MSENETTFTITRTNTTATVSVSVEGSETTNRLAASNDDQGNVDGTVRQCRGDKRAPTTEQSVNNTATAVMDKGEYLEARGDGCSKRPRRTNTGTRNPRRLRMMDTSTDDDSGACSDSITDTDDSCRKRKKKKNRSSCSRKRRRRSCLQRKPPPPKTCSSQRQRHHCNPDTDNDGDEMTTDGCNSFEEDDLVMQAKRAGHRSKANTTAIKRVLKSRRGSRHRSLLSKRNTDNYQKMDN